MQQHKSKRSGSVWVMLRVMGITRPSERVCLGTGRGKLAGTQASQVLTHHNRTRQPMQTTTRTPPVCHPCAPAPWHALTSCRSSLLPHGAVG